MLAALTLLLSAPPNVVLIMADDLGIGDLSCYHAGEGSLAPGPVRFPTPNIDRIAAAGLRFTDYHSNGAVCSPTRAALMTGRYQQRTGVDSVINADFKKNRHTGLSTDETTIADKLREAGYTTGVFGKWHLGYGVQFNPTRNGFDRFRGYVSGNVCYQLHYDRMGVPDWWDGEELRMAPGYTTDLITDYAVEFIAAAGEGPYFAYVAHECPHDPMQDRTSPPARRAGHVGSVWGPKKGEVEEVRLGMMTAMDEGVGRVLDAVAASPRADETLVIFCSDNGATRLGDSGVLRGNKGSAWEGGHRVPLLVRGPGVPAGVTDRLAMTMDLFPTLCGLAGVDPGEVDGIDLAAGGDWTADPERTVHWQHGASSAVRRGDLKLVRNGKKLGGLYDLATDVGEKDDLSQTRADVAAELSRLHAEWLADVTSGR